MKQAYIIAGPNGSGKTVLAKELIEELKLPFINADEIALTLAPAEDIARVRVKAGKLFLRKLTEHIRKGRSFIVETTLAGRNFAEIIRKMKRDGYEVILIYVFVENPQEAINRIKLRVAKGGHPVPDEDVIRRFSRSKKNFWDIYRKLADRWKMFLNSEDDFLLIAVGDKEEYNIISENGFALFRD